jgi:hypothetical protein
MEAVQQVGIRSGREEADQLLAPFAPKGDVSARAIDRQHLSAAAEHSVWL